MIAIRRRDHVRKTISIEFRFTVFWLHLTTVLRANCQSTMCETAGAQVHKITPKMHRSHRI